METKTPQNNPWHRNNKKSSPFLTCHVLDSKKSWKIFFSTWGRKSKTKHKLGMSFWIAWIEVLVLIAYETDVVSTKKTPTHFANKQTPKFK